MEIYTISNFKTAFRNQLKDIYPTLEIDSLSFIVFEEVLQYNRIDQIRNANEPLDSIQTNNIQEILNQLVLHKPLQYILGKTTFYNLNFELNEHVLIPRQETEFMVDLIIRKLYRKEYNRILDIGTGSGCIAIALKNNMPESNVSALEISNEALEIAERNAIINKAEVNFIQGDILKPMLDLNRSFDLIVSNPPYVRSSEIQMMQKNVLAFEPHTALFVPDENPLLFYKAIAHFCMKHLEKSGLLALEINEAFGEETKFMLENNSFTSVEILKDLNHKDRFITAIKI